MFTLDKVYKSYGSSTALQETTLKIDDGEFFVLVGASGGGKTTFLKLLNRLLEPTGGTILRDNRDIRSIPLRDLRLDTGYVLQQIALFPNLTVAENIALVPTMKGLAKKEIARLRKNGFTFSDWIPPYMPVVTRANYRAVNSNASALFVPLSANRVFFSWTNPSVPWIPFPAANCGKW